jgi:hypothetical protein
MTGAVERGAGIVDIDAFERGGEAIRIALAPPLPVGDDIETGALLVEDGDPGRVVLRLVEQFGRDPPQLPCAYPWREAAGEFFPINQPRRLGI